MRRALAILARFVLAAVFLYAAYAKLRDPWMIFAMEIDNMKLVPASMTEPLARVMPWFELLLGVLLVAGIKLRYVASASTALLLGFFSMLLFLYLRGFQGDCGCFGPGEQLGPKTLVRDGTLVAVSIWVTFDAFRRSKQAPVATM